MDMRNHTSLVLENMTIIVEKFTLQYQLRPLKLKHFSCPRHSSWFNEDNIFIHVDFVPKEIYLDKYLKYFFSWIFMWGLYFGQQLEYREPVALC
jgi:hypothetical protein